MTMFLLFVFRAFNFFGLVPNKMHDHRTVQLV